MKRRLLAIFNRRKIKRLEAEIEIQFQNFLSSDNLWVDLN